MFRAIRKKFRYGEKGFTLIELLVVVAVLGALAVVAIPNVGKFIGQGQTESYETELHNIQTACLALMADQGASQLDAGTYPIVTGDMDLILANSVALSGYVTGLDANGVVKSGCTYSFTIDGTVTQASTP